MSDKLEKHEAFSTLAEVHEAFVSWEPENQVQEFAIALWQTAEKLVCAESEYENRDELADAVFHKLRSNGSLTRCLTDDLRRLVIRHHAHGMRTVDAVEAIITDEAYMHITPFYAFKYNNVCGFKNIKDFLVGRLGYLKRSHLRFPDKYVDLYQKERQDYLDKIQDIPLVEPVERLQKLSQHYDELETMFENAEKATDKERYHKCMMRTLAGIELMTREPAYKSIPQQLTTEKRSLAQPESEENDVIDVSAEVTAVKEEES